MAFDGRDVLDPAPPAQSKEHSLLTRCHYCGTLAREFLRFCCELAWEHRSVAARRRPRTGAEQADRQS